MQAGAEPTRATIVFDGDQTLWDFRSAMVRALGETRIEIARVARIDLAMVPSIETLIETRDRVALQQRDSSLRAIRRAAFAATMTDLGQRVGPSVIDRINDFYTGRRYELCRPYPDTAPTLTNLDPGYRAVLLTNGNSYPERMGLRSFFDRVFVAEDLGATKPDPIVYASVADECGGDIFVSVGDALMNDIVGPQKAGWKAIWINRDGRELPPQVTPDATLSSLDGLDVALRSVLAS